MSKVAVTIDNQKLIDRKTTITDIINLLELQYRVQPGDVTVCFQYIPRAQLGQPCDLMIMITLEDDVPGPRPDTALLLRKLGDIKLDVSGHLLSEYRFRLSVNNDLPAYNLQPEVAARK